MKLLFPALGAASVSLFFFLATTTTTTTANSAFHNSWKHNDRQQTFSWNNNNNGENKNSKKTCKTKDGDVLKAGEDRLYKDHEQNCTIVTCGEAGLNSMRGECYSPKCISPRFKKKGVCCKTCPDGENCYLPLEKGGKGILWGKNVSIQGNRRCRCPIRVGLGWSQDLINAECEVIPPTTPVPNCRLPKEEEEEEEEEEEMTEEEEREEGEREEEEVEDGAGDGDREGGSVLEPGLEKIVPDGRACRKYVCDVRGQLTTLKGKCPEPNCTTPTRQDGACCMTCPGDPDSAMHPEEYVSPAPLASKSNTTYLTMDIFTLFRLLTYAFGMQSPGRSRSHHHHHGHGHGGHHHHHHHSHHHHHKSSSTRSDGTQNGGGEESNTKEGSETQAEGQKKQTGQQKGASWSRGWSWSASSRKSGSHHNRSSGKSHGGHGHRTRIVWLFG